MALQCPIKELSLFINKVTQVLFVPLTVGKDHSNASRIREVNEIGKNPSPPSVGLPFEKKGRNSVYL